MMSVRSLAIVVVMLLSQSTESSWVEHDEEWFFISALSNSYQPTWHEAREFCFVQGGDLASIRNSEVNEFIRSQLEEDSFDGDVWLGLNDLHQAGSFSWIDGSQLEYENWADEQPSDGNGIFVKLCTYSKMGEWYNEDCGETKSFVCISSSPSEPPNTIPPTDPIEGFCYEGYVAAGNKCFKVVYLDASEKVGREEAVAACKAGPGLNPGLASIHSAVENNAIVQQLPDIIGDNNGLWIGLFTDTHVYNSDDWKWLDNTPVDYTNWIERSDSNYYDFCAEMVTVERYQGQWNFIHCTQNRSYVCQTYKDPNDVIATPPVTSEHNCIDGYSPFGESCFKISEHVVHFEDAEAACIAEGSHLASFQTMAENAFVSNLMLSNDVDNMWLGLRYNNDLKTYYWLDNWHVNFANWGSNQPDFKDGGGCVALQENGQWVDENCNELKHHVCKTTTATPLTTPSTPKGSCPSSNDEFTWVSYGANCYGMPIAKGLQYYWYAEAMCIAQSAHLASIHDRVANDWLVSLAIEHWGTQPNSYWMGLHQTETGAPHSWIDGTAVEFVNWAPGEPSDIDGLELCTRVYMTNYVGTWDDFWCEHTMLPYVCSAPKGNQTSTPTLPGDEPGECPGEEWVHSGSSCLWFGANEFLTWDEAQHECRSRGSSLSSVHSDSENWLIYDGLLKYTDLPSGGRSTWIGLHRPDAGSKFRWTDGSVYDYANWISGEPGIHLCVNVIGSEESLWTTSDCDERKGFVCRTQKDVGPVKRHDTGAVVGGTIGVLLALTMVVVALTFFFKAKKSPVDDAHTNAGVDACMDASTA